MDAQSGWMAPMQALQERQRKIVQRWASFGPYYAMFPVAFARQVIAETTDAQDGVLDPFSGRGTTTFCAGELSRRGFGIELNPVGWLYSVTKLRPAPADRIIARAEEIAGLGKSMKAETVRLPEFYHRCFNPRVLQFLLAARSQLTWRTRRVDATLMAFILTYLHGKIDNGKPSAFSNQMRQTKAMAPDYSMRWWAEHGYNEAPDLSPVEFLSSRIRWRYDHGAPDFDNCVVRFGDSREVLRRQKSSQDRGFRLLLTSPPYCGVTSYYYDQWLRMWMLGEPEHPTRLGGQWKGKFEDKKAYEALLTKVFGSARRLLTDDATVYVRTDAREVTLSITKRVLLSQFPEKRAEFVPAPFSKATQTSLFGDKLPKPGEYDIILRPK